MLRQRLQKASGGIIWTSRQTIDIRPAAYSATSHHRLHSSIRDAEDGGSTFSKADLPRKVRRDARIRLGPLVEEHRQGTASSRKSAIHMVDRRIRFVPVRWPYPLGPLSNILSETNVMLVIDEVLFDRESMVLSVASLKVRNRPVYARNIA